MAKLPAQFTSPFSDNDRGSTAVDTNARAPEKTMLRQKGHRDNPLCTCLDCKCGIHCLCGMPAPVAKQIDHVSQSTLDEPRPPTTQPTPRWAQKGHDQPSAAMDRGTSTDCASVAPRQCCVRFGEVQVLHHQVLLDDSKLPSDGLAPLGLGQLQRRENERLETYESRRAGARQGVGHIPADERRASLAGLKRESSLERIERENAELKRAHAQSLREHIAQLTAPSASLDRLETPSTICGKGYRLPVGSRLVFCELQAHHQRARQGTSRAPSASHAESANTTDAGTIPLAKGTAEATSGEASLPRRPPARGAEPSLSPCRLMSEHDQCASPRQTASGESCRGFGLK